MVNVISIIKNSKPGIMLYTTVIPKDTKRQEFCLVIREESRYLKKLRNNPVFQIRTGLFNMNNVLIMPILVLVNRNFDMLYECMFNYYQESGGHNFIDLLSNQKRILVSFFNDDGKIERKIALNNNLKNINEIKNLLNNYPAWSMKEFDIAKSELYKKYGSPQELWYAMSEQNDA